MTQQPTRICILGGGFGGLYTALRLSQLPWDDAKRPQIILVDQRDRFLFSPLLYELVTGELETWEIAPPFTELLADTGIQFYQTPIAGIDVEARQVQLQNGQAIPYDRLVLALGGETPLDLAPGVADYAIPFRTIIDAYRLEERLRVLEASDADKIRVAIVGAGYSGVELACKLAERLGERGRLRLIEISDDILRNSPEFNQETARRVLSDRGIWLDLETRVTALSPETISLEYKGKVDEIPVDLVLWTVGTKVPDVVQTLPLKQNQRHQLVVTPTLQAIDQPEVFVLGDLADCRDAEGQRVPSTAQVAIQQADYVGWNVWASLTERPLLSFRYQYLGEMLTLGVDNAVFSGLGLKLEGTPAHILRRMAYLYRMPTLDHQIKVGVNWIVRPLQDFLANLA
jgi:NADH dehydrogenase